MASPTFHIVQRMAPGGIETLVLDLALADESIHVVSLEGSAGSLTRDWDRLAALGPRLTGLEKPDRLSPSHLRRLAGLFRAARPRAVVAHHVGPLLYGGLAARLAGVRGVAHVEHDGWHYGQPKRRRLARLAHRLVRPRRAAVSHATAMAAADALGPGDTVIIPNGIDLAQFRPRDQVAARDGLGLPQDVRIIGTVGRLSRVKGHDVLLNAAQRLPDDIHVALVGDGPERASLETLVRDLGIASRVHVLGHRDGVHQIYPAFDVLALPSRAEGLPRCIIEAQACGVPVVASDVGGTREAICPITGELVPAGDAARLATALGLVLSRPLARSPRLHVDPSFSFERTLDAYRALAQEHVR
jgi:glycosyltransferase involved in cell wall biosynthesis